MLCIKNGNIHNAIVEEPFVADILVEDGKIVKIEENIEVPADCEVVDATGLQIFPGFVDAHCHIGTDGYAMGFEGQDYNEMGDIVSPQLRGIDSINPMDPTFPMAAQAGVTSVCTGPGSANVLGGTFVAMKTVGQRVDNMIIKTPVAMKCAFGENPKRCYKDKGNYARMSTASKLREMLFRAKDYMERKEAAGDDISRRPAFDMKLESLIPVLKKEIPLKAHAHRADDMFTAIRIAKEFDLNITMEHCTEGHLIVDELVKEDLPLAVGPSLGHATKIELQHKSFKTPGILANAGCKVSIITDSPVIPEQYLSLCAGLAVKEGMKPFDALQAITINPAKHIGIADRVGSLEVGKDADIVLSAGCPFESSNEIVDVYVNGVKVEKERILLMIQGAIFDMDGLMLDTERISARGWIEAGRVMGVPIDEPFLAKFRGTNAAYSRRLCKERFGEAFDYDRAREIRTAYLHEVIDRTGVPVKKGLRELLSWLNEQNIPCAVATSTRQELAEEYLEKANLLKWFSYRIFGNLVEKSKPDPEIFLRAAEGLHRKASECAVFEDSPNGIRAGIAAGSLVIAIPDITEIPEELRQQADAVLPDLLAARDFLKEYQV